MSNAPRDAGCWNRFRRYGIRSAKSILSSGADIAGDWIYYLRVARDFGDDFDKYEIPLLVFSVVSSVMGFLLLCSLYLDYRCRCQSKNDSKWGSWINRLLRLEILLEDIPQFVLTALVSADFRGLDPYAVFNLSTSGTNFVLNILDLIEVNDDGSEGDASNNAQAASLRSSSDVEAGGDSNVAVTNARRSV